MSDLSWTTEIRKIKGLKDFDKNPRQITEEQFERLKQSIKDFGYVELVAVDTDNTIVAGHMRVRAIRKVHGDRGEIEVRVPSRKLTEQERERYAIISNKVTGDWDYDTLASSWDLDMLFDVGFEPGAFDLDLGDEKKEPIEDDETESIEPGKDEDAKTKLGDLYELNEHRIVCGDSTNLEYVNLCMGENKPILMVTDPPYGVEYNAKWRSHEKILVKGRKKAISIGKVQNDDRVDWSEALKHFPGDIAYIWYASTFSSPVQNSLESLEYKIVSQIIWVKQHFAISRGDYHWKHEPCFYAVKKDKKHNWQGARDQSTCWEIKNLCAFGKSNEERTAHSTQKPIECMAKPIRNNTGEGQGVYDPFLGSGTTLIAAENLNRKCYGIEISPAYIDICINRWKNLMEKENKPYKIKINGIEQ